MLFLGVTWKEVCGSAAVNKVSFLSVQHALLSGAKLTHILQRAVPALPSIEG